MLSILSNSQTKASHLLSGRISKKQAPDSQYDVWSIDKVWRLSVFHSLSRQKRMYHVDFPGLGLMNVAEVLPRTELTECLKAQRGKVLSLDSFSKTSQKHIATKWPKNPFQNPSQKFGFRVLDFLHGFWMILDYHYHWAIPGSISACAPSSKGPCCWVWVREHQLNQGSNHEQTLPLIMMHLIHFVSDAKIAIAEI